MSRRPVVLSFLWPKNYTMLVELARQGNVDIAAPQNLVPAQMGAALAEVSARYIQLAGDEYTGLAAATELDAAARASRIAAQLPSLVGTPAAATPQTTARTVELLQNGLPQSLQHAMAFIDELDLLCSREDVVGILMNETDLPAGKAAALWAKARGIPSFLLSHGSNIGAAYTVTRCMLADYLFVFGPRGKETYLDIGIPDDRMVVTGNPAWDHYPGVLASRAQCRTECYSRLGLREGEPMVVFATIWNTRLTALHEADVFEKTVRAFFQGCRRLRDGGTAFNAVVKDRPSNAHFGKAAVAKIAEEEGFTDYAYAGGDMEVYIAAADMLVSYDTNTFVEAMIAGLPCINLWTPSTWLIGPGFDVADGVPLVRYDDPDALARLMNEILTDPAVRTALSTQLKAALPRFHIAMDGGSKVRCVQAILARLKPAAGASAQPSNGKAKTAPAGLMGLLKHTPRLVLDVGTGNGEIARELKKYHALAVVHSVAFNDVVNVDFSQAGFAPQSIDTVFLSNALEELYDPLRFLAGLKPYLAPDAQVLAAIPNVRNLWLLLETLGGNWDYTPEGQLNARRIRFFTLKSIVELFNAAGYTIAGLDQRIDERVPAVACGPDARVNVDLPNATLKNLSAHDISELRTLDFLIDARPNPGASAS